MDRCFRSRVIFSCFYIFLVVCLVIFVSSKEENDMTCNYGKCFVRVIVRFHYFLCLQLMAVGDSCTTWSYFKHDNAQCTAAKWVYFMQIHNVSKFARFSQYYPFADEKYVTDRVVLRDWIIYTMMYENCTNLVICCQSLQRLLLL